MKQIYVESFMGIGFSVRELSCKRTAGHTDRFYSVLTFLSTQKEHVLFILMVIENEPFKVVFGMNVKIKSVERIVSPCSTYFKLMHLLILSSDQPL